MMCTLFNYNQQDATLYNILYNVNALHVSGGLFAHHKEDKNCTHSIWYVPGLLAATANCTHSIWYVPGLLAATANCTHSIWYVSGLLAATANCTHSIWYVPGLLAATGSGSSKQAWHIPDAVGIVLELLMMGGETARNMYSIDNNKEYCITLHLVGCT